MKTRLILWLVATVILCFTAFWFGRSQSRPEYDQNPLAIDGALLATLRAGDTTNAIEKLEVMLDFETLAAMHNRPLLQGRDRMILDRTLERVARYREQYPRHIENIT